MASWYAISVAGPDGTTTIASGFGVSYSQPFTPTRPGAYTLTATMDDGFNPRQQITAHFTIVPDAPDVALPGKAGSVESSSGDTTVNWTAGTFAEAVRVNVADEPSIGGTFGNGSRVVRVTVTRLADGSVAADASTQPLELVFAAGAAGVPSSSEDGVAWSPVPKLTSDVLPPGQRDGYFVDPTGAVHVLTRHLTFFGVLTPEVDEARADRERQRRAPAGRGPPDLGDRPDDARARASSPRSTRRTASSSRPGRAPVGAGASTLKLTLPAAKVQTGICTIVLQATSARPDDAERDSRHAALALDDERRDHPERAVVGERHQSR